MGTASDKFGVGDTVTISGKVTYSSAFGGTVTVETDSGDEYEAEVKDVTLVKKAIPAAPGVGKVIVAVSKYGTTYKFLVDHKSELTLLDSDGRTYTNYATWESLHRNGSYTSVTVV